MTINLSFAKSKLLVFHFIRSLHLGGTETHLLRLLHASDHNHIVVPIVFKGALIKQFKSKSIQVITLREFLVFFCSHMFLGDHYSEFNILFNGWLYYGSLISVFFALLSGRQSFCSIRSEYQPLFNKPLLNLTIRLLALLSRLNKSILIFNSQSARTTHSRLFNARKSYVIPNGISSFPFKYALRSTPVTNLNPFTIIHVSRFDIYKNPYLFIDALSSLKNRYSLPFNVIFCGHGFTSNNKPLFATLASRSLLDHVTLVGPTTELSNYYIKSDLCVLTSTSESFPNTLLECIYLGLPCLSTHLKCSDITSLNPVSSVDSRPHLIADQINKLASYISSNNCVFRQKLLHSKRAARSSFDMNSIAREFGDLWSGL